MKFKSFRMRVLWLKGCFVNRKDLYGTHIYTYAKDWATMMETLMEQGKTIKDIAKETSHKADTEGITGFMYGAAVSVLAQCWVYGEELRQWHNLDVQIQCEGEKANREGGVLNPALLKFGGKLGDTEKLAGSEVKRISQEVK